MKQSLSMRVKSPVWMLFCLVLLVFVAAACSADSSTSGGSGSSPPAPASTNAAGSTSNGSATGEDAEEPIELRFLHVFGGSQGEAITELADRYNASQSKVVVVAEQVQGFYNGLLERLQTLAVAGQLPDLAIGSYANFDYMQTRLPIRPIQQFIDSDAYDLSDFNQQMLQLGRDSQDEQIAMPFAVSTPLIYVNKEHFAEAGIPYTDEPASWEQVRGWAKQLADADPDRYGIFFQMDFDMWMFQTLLETGAGQFADLDSKEVLFNSDAGISVLNYWLDMVNEDQSYPRMDGNQAAQAFQNGDLSMIVATTGNLISLTQNVPFDLGIMLLPTWEGQSSPRKLPAGGAGLYIFEKDEKTETAAWDFVKFASSPEGTALIAEKMGYMAIRNSARNELLADYFAANPLAESSYKQSGDIIRWFAWPGEHAARINQVMLDHVQGAFAGTLTGDEALDKAAAEVNRILGW